MDFNKVVITGYVAKEHEVREVKKNDKTQKVLNNVILVNGYNDKTTPIKIAAWNKYANALNNGTIKGSRVLIEGSWEVNVREVDGNTIYNNYLLVQNVTFLETKDTFEAKKNKVEQKKDPFGNIAAGKETIHDMPDNFEPSDDDLPF
ncbi:single-stranded DNA-binding protein [Staphylococcus epidermidis]|nr:single-stranded DNA-binding protein [Staphylococcus epidermidis]MBM6209895.1 single-stranded DNA-binding protein [Staphylococcus epidermidis]MBM6212258.1 single-stranded DNA-binding protein [Staphylococcus epidermidis]MBM6219279.1 single-stranded DNA-binding protein [Staphylococcus epidermidis]MBM6223801.1 single-stranded DNA-binding protein [Staphylococcus epidermidis]